MRIEGIIRRLQRRGSWSIDAGIEWSGTERLWLERLRDELRLGNKPRRRTRPWLGPAETMNQKAYSGSDEHDGNRVPTNREQDVVEKRRKLAGSRRTQHVVHNARDRHFVLKPVDRQIELGSALFDVFFEFAQVLCHPVTLSDSTSASRFSERTVLCGAREDADMAWRP